MICEIDLEADESTTTREAEAAAEQILDAYREVAAHAEAGEFCVTLSRATDDDVAGFERNPSTCFVPAIIVPEGSAS
jgi:hypothetical protein